MTPKELLAEMGPLPTSVGESRAEYLERHINRLLDQNLDDVCWIDVYTILGGLVGRTFDPLLLPKEKFEANCKRFTSALYDGKPYPPCQLTDRMKELVKVEAEHAEAVRMLLDAGHGTPALSLPTIVYDLLESVRLRGMEDS